MPLAASKVSGMAEVGLQHLPERPQLARGARGGGFRPTAPGGAQQQAEKSTLDLRVKSHQHVLEGGQMPEESTVLKGASDTPGGNSVGHQMMDRVATKQDAAGS